jgi:signal transduction histidine kinase
MPKHETDAAMIPLETWWKKLQQRQEYRNLEWQSDGVEGNELIPTGLFDSIVDNLIDNARNKCLLYPELRVKVSVRGQPFSLSVCDNGDEIPEALASHILHTVVESEQGFGVGLYQASKWAEQAGYRLELKENVKGRVCFEVIEIGKNTGRRLDDPVYK